jgi:acyl-CoA synthetase (AMP-forming)/AMP-acid ligase II
MLGVLRLGATWVPLSDRDNASSLAGQAERLGLTGLLYPQSSRGKANQLAERWAFAGAPLEIEQIWEGQQRGNAHPRAGYQACLAERGRAPSEDLGERLAVIFPTGGTTGKPQAVRFSHRTLTALLQHVVDVLNHDHPVLLVAGALSHVQGRLCLAVLAAGGECVIIPEFSGQAALEAINRYQITMISAVPTMLERLVEAVEAAGGSVTPTLRQVVVGGAPVPRELLRRALTALGPVVAQAYGQTEAPLVITEMTASDYFDADGSLLEERLGSCGRASRWSSLRIVSPTGAELPEGDIGEIVVTGDFVMDGYFDEPPISPVRRVRSVHTGDLGYLQEGFLTIVGRSKEVIITGGFNVYPREIEEALRRDSRIEDAAVVGVPDPTWGEAVCAFVTVPLNVTLDVGQCKQRLRDDLGPVKAPKELYVIDRIPRTEHGKVATTKLRAAALARRET